MTEALPISARVLARLLGLVGISEKKEKMSVTLSGNLVKVIDALAGTSRRSAWIERAVRVEARRELRRRRYARELARLNARAEQLNADGADSAVYQAPWDTEA